MKRIAWRCLPILCIAARLHAGAEECAAVDGDRIVMKDLARVIPAFAAAPPDVLVGLAPVPGATRRLLPEDLARLGREHGLAIEHAGVCFEVKVAPLTADRVEAALRAALAEDVNVELVDFSRAPVPEGPIEFPRQALAPGRETIWRGRIHYAPSRSVVVWAKVRISSDREVVVAARDLSLGQIISPEDVRLERNMSTLAGLPPLASIEEAVGRVVRRRFQAGQPLNASALTLPNVIERGETVTVEVREGAAYLKFEAKAETAGRVGDSIDILNPVNKRRFRAKVVGKGLVCVNPQRS